MTFNQLRSMPMFTRANYYEAMKQETGKTTAGELTYSINRAIAENKILHVGRNQYVYANDKRQYRHTYSEAASMTASEISKEYPSVDFRIFELVELNPFVNHQLAHNNIFVFVENYLVDYVFDSLRRKHPGRVMLKPSVNDYYRYRVEDMIVVLRLPSESPNGIGCQWNSQLEKILVDISVDKLLCRIVFRGEYRNIFETAFGQYNIDKKAMFRYSNRRGAGTKFKTILEQYASFILEDGEMLSRETSQ